MFQRLAPFPLVLGCSRPLVGVAISLAASLVNQPCPDSRLNLFDYMSCYHTPHKSTSFIYEACFERYGSPALQYAIHAHKKIGTVQGHLHVGQMRPHRAATLRSIARRKASSENELTSEYVVDLFGSCTAYLNILCTLEGRDGVRPATRVASTACYIVVVVVVVFSH